MVSDRLINYINTKMSADYDDLEEVDMLLDRWVETARRDSVDERWKAFRGALESDKFKEKVIDPAVEIKEHIEEADVITDLPDLSKLDIKHFQTALQKGIGKKTREFGVQEAIRGSTTVDQIEAISIPDVFPRAVRGLRISRGIKLAKIKIRMQVPAVTEKTIWKENKRLIRNTIARVRRAKTADALLKIDLDQIPTVKGRRKIQRQISKRIEELAS